MQYSLVKSFLESAWQVDMLTLSRYSPLFWGAVSGMEFDREEEPAENKNYKISLTGVLMDTVGTSEEDPEQDNRVVHVLPVRGIMIKHDAECGPRGTRTLGNRLRQADKDRDVIGHVIVFESGGGQSSAVAELSEAIESCKKPVIAWVDGYMCSAAQYVGSYCRETIASRDTDIVGCIGTMMEIEGRKKVSEDSDGTMYVRVYADGSEEKNLEFEQAVEGNFQLVKERVLNPLNEQFKAAIRTNRPSVTDTHLKGLTYKAKDVLGILVDSIGSIQDAVNRVAELSKQSNTQSNNSTNMKKELLVPTLLGLLAISELVHAEGQTSLNSEQLEAIEAALLAGKTAESSVSQLTKERNDARQELAAAQETITQQTTKIATLEKAPGDASAAAPKDTDSTEGDDVSEMASFGTRMSEAATFLSTL